MDLPSLHTMLLTKLPSMDLQNAISNAVFHTALLLIRELVSQEKKAQKRAHTHGIHWSYHVPHHPEAAGLIEWWNGLFFFLIFIYLSALGLSCGTWDLLVAAHGIFSCSMLTLCCSMWDLVP